MEIKNDIAALHEPLHVHRRHKAWNLECWFLGLAGLAMLFRRGLALEMSVVQETIVLVVFLGGLMGITRIPFPTAFFGKPIPLWAYPLISGGISGFMDSFLVLLMVGAARLDGSEGDQLKFRAYNTIAALIGGLTLYFGEVYMLPLALKYGMRHWHSMLPIVPPVIVFLAVLAWLASRLDLRVIGVKGLDDVGEGGRQWGDWAEFAAAIALLLLTHNALLCLGALLTYSFSTGQGEDLIDVMKTKTEMGVMLLLIFAAFMAGPIEPYMARWSGWWAFIPAALNGVLAGAVFPASGDVWFDAHILSTAVLLTPISSLVGVMLFKTLRDWKAYILLAVPLAFLWFALAGAWFHGPWLEIKPRYERLFGAPSLLQVPSR
jgi:hypothetical protein